MRDRLQVLQIPSVARLVSFNGTPTALPEAEIEALKASLERGLHAVPHPYLKAGRRVRVTTGPLEGFEGIVIRKSNSLRFVVSLDLIQRSIAVHTEADWLEPL